jgi:hypothetical protein
MQGNGKREAGINFWTINFKERLNALDDFRSAAYFVASGFQPARGWRPNSPASGSGVGGPGD